MLIPEHEIILSTDGTILNLRDTTPLADYVAAGIDIDTDIVSATFTIVDPDSNSYSIDVTSQFPTYIRDAAGFDVSTTSLAVSSLFFPDGIYTSTFILVENSTGSSVTYESETITMFLSQIKQVAMSQIVDSDWKILYNPHYNQVSSDIRKKLLLTTISFATESGLIDYAETIRLYLNKLCSYEP